MEIKESREEKKEVIDAKPEAYWPHALPHHEEAANTIQSSSHMPPMH
jgi:hypothetical protein